MLRAVMLFAGLGMAALLGAATARAAPEEIQVYMNEMDQPGEFGLDLHNNYVLSGSPALEYPGAQKSLHRFRLTPEVSYGLTPTIDLGAYLPLLTLTEQGKLSAEGIKFRIKYIAAKSFAGHTWWGLNIEVGRVSHTLDINPWNRAGHRSGRFGKWLLAANEIALVSGPQPGPVARCRRQFASASVRTQLGVKRTAGLVPLVAWADEAGGRSSTWWRTRASASGTWTRAGARPRRLFSLLVFKACQCRSAGKPRHECYGTSVGGTRPPFGPSKLIWVAR
jgi:hypothetical protein